MKKRIIIIAGIALAAILLVIIVASGHSDDGGIAGDYVMIEASGSGAPMFKAEVGKVTLKINEKSKDDQYYTGTLTMMDEPTKVAVDTENKKISFNGGEDFTQYSFRENKLTVERNGYRMVFKKK